MNFLPRLINRVSGFGKAMPTIRSLSANDTGERSHAFDGLWDEALMSSMHSETARMFLEHMGPRWK